ncbi:MAG TPA: maleylpyruvate isomerase family mycothiol-dependent enzyme [Mycobacterium sp.]
MTWNFEAYCAEIVTQTTLLADCLDSADMTVDVLSCPGWNVGQLVRHLGGGQRWAAEMVSTRAEGWLPDDHFRDLSGYAHEDPDVLRAWLADSATALAEALDTAGPDATVATGPVPDGTASFYARRFTHETAVHRADATLALGEEYALEPDVAIDGIDEWLELGSLPFHFEVHPRMRELLGPGRTMHLHATDAGADVHAEWVVDLTGDEIAWRRTHEKSAVAVRGPLTELLLIVYKRRSPRDGTVEVLGDADLLDFWLDRVSFG